MINYERPGSWSSESGQDTLEYALFVGFILLVCLTAVAFVKWPDTFKNAALTTIVVGGILGGLAWATKGSMTALTRHAQLVILESLSATGPRSRAEVKKLFRGKQIAMRWFAIDALANLVDSGKVTMGEEGRYAIVNQSHQTAPRPAYE